MASAEAPTSTSSEEGISIPGGHEAEIMGYKEKITGYEAKITAHEAEIKENMETIGRIGTQMAGGGGGGGGSQEESTRLYERNQTLQQAVTALQTTIAETLKNIHLLREQQGRQSEKLCAIAFIVWRI
jgi:hypothetical protein